MMEPHDPVLSKVKTEPESNTEGCEIAGSQHVFHTSSEHIVTSEGTCTCSKSEVKEESEIKTELDMMEPHDPVLSKVKTEPKNTEGCESSGSLEKMVWVKTERCIETIPMESEETPDFSNLDLPSSIEEFFTKKKLGSISKMAKTRYRSIRENNKMMKKFGLPASVPEFMQPKRARRLQFRDLSESESDEEWRPKPKRKHGAKTGWCPPYRLPSTTVTSATINKGSNSPKPKRHVKQKKSHESDVEPHVYSFRKRPTTNYMKLDVPNDDKFIYCEECNLEHEGDCPEHGPLLVVEDTPTQVKKRGKWNRALETLPPGLEVKESSIHNAGLGVFTTKLFPSRSRFGPYQGDIVSDPKIAHASGYCWQVCNGDSPSHFMDAQNVKASNWMRYVNCARSMAEQNITAYQNCGEIYYRAHRDIAAGTEILVWYGSEYGKELGIIREGDKRRRHLGTSKGADSSYDDTDCDWTFSDIGSSDLEFTDSDENKKTDTMQNTSAITEKQQPASSNPKTSKLLLLEKKYKCQQCASAFVKFTSLRTHMMSYHKQKLSNVSMSSVGGVSNMLGKREEDLKVKRFICEVCDTTFTTVQYLIEHKLVHCDSTLLSDVTKLTVCGKAFTQSGHLQTHQRTHTGDKPYKCTDCGKAFTQLSSVKYHQRTHTSDKPYKCTDCGNACTELSLLKTNQRTHTSDKPYKCPDCGKAFTQLGSLNRHQRIHTGDKPYKCADCGKAFIELSNLKTHQRTHTGEKPYLCTDCGRTFTQLSSVMTHKCTHTTDKPCKCTDCGKTFTVSSFLKTHQRTHSGDKPYLCTECGKGFAQLYSMKRHQRKHTGDKPYKCTDCGKAFSQSGNLQSHQRKHTGDKPYKCTDCGKAFTHFSGVMYHQRTHTGDKPYKCTDCGKAFTVSSLLKRHQRIHTGDKPYLCTECGKAYKQLDDLKRHQRTHTGDKPYKCTDCGKAFRLLFYLKTHQRTHTGEKPYLCTDCDKTFTQLSSLKTHKRTHTGDKPYKCTDCGKAFTQLGSLQTHQRTHTGDKPYKCNDCGKAFTVLCSLKTHQRTRTCDKPYKCPHCTAVYSNLKIFRAHVQNHADIL